jgi:hypothetical protein
MGTDGDFAVVVVVVPSPLEGEAGDTVRGSRHCLSLCLSEATSIAQAPNPSMPFTFLPLSLLFPSPLEGEGEGEGYSRIINCCLTESHKNATQSFTAP